MAADHVKELNFGSSRARNRWRGEKNCEIPRTIRVDLVVASFVILKSGVGVNGSWCGRGYAAYGVQHIVGLSKVTAAVKVHHDHALAGFHGTVAMENLPAYGRGIVAVEGRVITNFLGLNRISSLQAE
jgi:hypothetical protein